MRFGPSGLTQLLLERRERARLLLASSGPLPARARAHASSTWPCWLCSTSGTAASGDCAGACSSSSGTRQRTTRAATPASASMESRQLAVPPAVSDVPWDNLCAVSGESCEATITGGVSAVSFEAGFDSIFAFFPWFEDSLVLMMAFFPCSSAAAVFGVDLLSSFSTSPFDFAALSSFFTSPFDFAFLSSLFTSPFDFDFLPSSFPSLMITSTLRLLVPAGTLSSTTFPAFDAGTLPSPPNGQ
mmetsp:Transcript_12786/g.34818  ORF Transcript_12786/g.34818 Transcript_12786/m.34818 type:complete len:243 (+) Transcript_12786:411-1139(+)